MFYKVSNGFGRKSVFTDDVKVAMVEFKKLVAEGAEIVEMTEYTENSKGSTGCRSLATGTASSGRRWRRKPPSFFT